MYYPCSENKGAVSFAITAILICVFVFAYADCSFYHEAVHFISFLDQALLLPKSIGRKPLSLLSAGLLKLLWHVLQAFDVQGQNAVNIYQRNLFSYFYIICHIFP